MTGPFKAAVIQMRSGSDPQTNALVFEEMVRDAASQAAAYIQTPEMTGVVQRSRKELETVLKKPDADPVVAAGARLAAELGVFIHIGSTAVRNEAGGISNRAFLFGRDGLLLETYDKIHMFDVDLDNGESWRESAVYTPGERCVVTPTPLGTIGLAICYDMRFAHLFRDQAVAGAEILTAPAAFTRQTGEKHWHVLLRARAIENGAWMLAAAQGGVHEDGRETYGHSLIIDPAGRIVAEVDHDEPGIAVAEIDVSRVAEARAKIPNLKNGRNYKVCVTGEPSGTVRRVS